MRSNRWVSGRVAALATVAFFAAVAAAVGLQSSQAGTSTKPYSAVFSVSGATVTLTMQNLSSQQQLGSADIALGTTSAGAVLSATPTSNPFSFSPAQANSTASWSWDQSLANTIDLRNLNLAPGQTLTFTMSAPTCDSGTYTWGLTAKQSNDYNGPPGNNFNLNSTAGLTTTLSGHCVLTWSGATEPASTFRNTAITGSAYDTSGSRVTVRAVDATTLQLVPTATGTVTLTLATGNALCPATTSLTNVQADLQGGIATFSTLTAGATAATGCQLIASDTADGYTSSSPNPDPFDISYGTPCSGGTCPTSSGTIDESAKLDAGATGAFTFLAFNTSSIPTSVTAAGGSGGCAGFQSVYSANNSSGGVFNETDSGATGLTTKTFRYYINKKLVQKKFGNNSGQQFIPICAGGQRLGGDGKPIDCVTDQTNGGTGWMSKKIDPITGLFTTGFTSAVCDPHTGLWWGILTSFQDYNNYPSGTTPSNTPNVTGWNSDTTYRWFDISVPNPWDWRAGT